jgi:putative component of membrane protein insertase Oxa1/YidC/SpoIIIJ protein YidD
MNDLLRDLALQAISLYQRYLSPYKGYRCAYAFHTGCASCSRLGFRAIRWRGVFDGLSLLVRRLGRCRDAFERYRQRPLAPTAACVAPTIARDQRGFCDVLGCIPCDAVPMDAACDCLSVGDCGMSPCDCLDLRSEEARRNDRANRAAREARRRREMRDERWPN